MTRPQHVLVRASAAGGRRLQGLTSAGLALVLLLALLATQQPKQEPESTLVPVPPSAQQAAPAAAAAVPAARPAVRAPRPAAPARRVQRRRVAPRPAPVVVAAPQAVPAYGPMELGYQRDAHGKGLCPGGTQNAPLGLTCRVALVQAAPGAATGYLVRFQVCPTTAARFELRFATEAEVAMSVLDRSGRAVWTWRPPRPFQDDPHVLVSDVGACWVWETPWNQVDDAGRPLADGGYELQVEFLEVDDGGTYTRSFTAH